MKKIYPIIFVLGLFAFFHVGFVQASTTVDLKANGSDGTINVPRNTNVLLSWTLISSRYNPFPGSLGGYCEASGGWSGRKTDIGQEFTGALTSNKIYTITCNPLSGGYDWSEVTVDTVTIYVTDQAPTPVPTIVPTPTPTPAPATNWNTLFNESFPGWDEQGYTWGSITDGNDVTRYYRKEGTRWVQKSSEAAAQAPYSTATPAPAPIATCDSTAKAIVTAAGGCNKIDPAVYSHIYNVCCRVITKETLLQMLDEALADGVLDKTEKLSLLSALDAYLSRL